MSDNTPNAPQDQPRRIERRRANRPQIVPLEAKVEITAEEDEMRMRFRPEVIAIALMVIALLILAAIAI